LISPLRYPPIVLSGQLSKERTSRNYASGLLLSIIHSAIAQPLHQHHRDVAEGIPRSCAVDFGTPQDEVDRLEIKAVIVEITQ
jgi:hypothetical protein